MSEFIKLNDVVKFPVYTYNPSGGALIDADETPRWEVFEDDSDTLILTGLFTSSSRAPGTYRGSFHASGVDGFNTGSYYVVEASGKVNGIVGRTSVKEFVLGDVYNANIVEVSGTTVDDTGNFFKADTSSLATSNEVISISGDVGNIKTQTDKFQFDSRNYVLSSGDANIVSTAGTTTTGHSDFHAPPSGIAYSVWEELLTGSTHNTATSAGRRLREGTGTVIRNDTAQGGTLITITLDAGASSINNFYKHTKIVIVSGTGVGQERVIFNYNGTSKVARISPDWDTIPDSTSEFLITLGTVHAETTSRDIRVGSLEAGGTTTSVILDDEASSIDDYYNDNMFIIPSSGVRSFIKDYDGGTRTVTLDPALPSSPPSGTFYEINADASPAMLADEVWNSGVGDILGDTSKLQFDGRNYVLSSGDANIVEVSGNPVSIEDFRFTESNLYYANVKYIKDYKANSQEEINVQWYKNDQPVGSGEITNPMVSLYNTSNGSAYFENQFLDYASVNLGALRYNNTTVANILPSGEAGLCVTSGTIDSSVREWRQLVGIDYL